MDYQKAWHSCQNGPILGGCLLHTWLDWRMCEREGVGGESVRVLQGGRKVGQAPSNL